MVSQLKRSALELGKKDIRLSFFEYVQTFMGHAAGSLRSPSVTWTKGELSGELDVVQPLLFLFLDQPLAGSFLIIVRLGFVLVCRLGVL